MMTPGLLAFDGKALNHDDSVCGMWKPQPKLPRRLSEHEVGLVSPRETVGLIVGVVFPSPFLVRAPSSPLLLVAAIF